MSGLDRYANTEKLAAVPPLAGGFQCRGPSGLAPGSDGCEESPAAEGIC
jgi:hypothetical protein